MKNFIKFAIIYIIFIYCVNGQEKNEKQSQGRTSFEFLGSLIDAEITAAYLRKYSGYPNGYGYGNSLNGYDKFPFYGGHRVPPPGYGGNNNGYYGGNRYPYPYPNYYPPNYPLNPNANGYPVVPSHLPPPFNTGGYPNAGYPNYSNVGYSNYPNYPIPVPPYYGNGFRLRSAKDN